mmetsp:Transcript_35307/g.63672  ORF Transcript_35307/g.63672 Transcript_35307/m.63672 type:complete len:254 (-) Transcript_35307:332-1093(-)
MAFPETATRNVAVLAWFIKAANYLFLPVFQGTMLCHKQLRLLPKSSMEAAAPPTSDEAVLEPIDALSVFPDRRAFSCTDKVELCSQLDYLAEVTRHDQILPHHKPTVVIDQAVRNEAKLLVQAGKRKVLHGQVRHVLLHVFVGNFDRRPTKPLRVKLPRLHVYPGIEGCFLICRGANCEDIAETISRRRTRRRRWRLSFRKAGLRHAGQTVVVKLAVLTERRPRGQKLFCRLARVARLQPVQRREAPDVQCTY